MINIIHEENKYEFKVEDYQFITKSDNIITAIKQLPECMIELIAKELESIVYTEKQDWR